MEPMSYSRSQSTGLVQPAPPPVPAHTRQHRSKTEPSTAPSLEHALGRSHEEAHVHAGSARKRKQAKSEETSLKAGAKTSIGSSGDKSQPSSSAHSKLIESGDFMKLSMSDFRPGESSELAEAEGSEEGFRPLLLFIPLRLGQDKFNPDYTEALKVRGSQSVCCSGQEAASLSAAQGERQPVCLPLRVRGSQSVCCSK